jgi:hypothetical protein
MHPSDKLLNAASSARAAAAGADGTRRMLLMTPLIASLPLVFRTSAAHASKVDPSKTAVTLPDKLRFVPWSGGPAGSGEMAPLYGSLDKPGPYLVLMKWHPGYMSAPHTYLTDRMSVVVSGTWWVNSGADFDPRTRFPCRPEALCCGTLIRPITTACRGPKRNRLSSHCLESGRWDLSSSILPSHLGVRSEVEAASLRSANKPSACYALTSSRPVSITLIISQRALAAPAFRTGALALSACEACSARRS